MVEAPQINRLQTAMEQALRAHFLDGGILQNEEQFAHLKTFLRVERAPYLTKMDHAIAALGLDYAEIGRKYAYGLFIEPLATEAKNGDLLKAFDLLANSQPHARGVNLSSATQFDQLMNAAIKDLDLIGDVHSLDHKNMMLHTFDGMPEAFFERSGVSASGFRAEIAAAFEAQKAAHTVVEAAAEAEPARSFAQRLLYKAAPAEGLCMKKVSAVGLGVVVGTAALYYALGHQGQDGAAGHAR